MKNRLFFLMVMLLFSSMLGCTTIPVKNKQLEHYSKDYGYRIQNLDLGEKNSDSLFVILTFSGGGTRASSLSYGVLEKLRDTEIMWEGQQRRLLDEVDIISSVSGGSLTAAYYGLFGEQIFEDFEEKVLYQDIQGLLARSFVTIRNSRKLASPFFSRTDLMAEEFHRQIFEEKTFGDLLERKQRPYIIINSTDLSLGNRFEFTQDQFDLLYSDLGSYPIGLAVAASAAFPGALTPMILNNFENRVDYELPDWVQQELAKPDPRSILYNLAVDIKTYTESGRPYIHLIDGGVSDNLGLMPVIQAMMRIYSEESPQTGLRYDRIKKVVIITVNAKRETQTDWDTREKVIRMYNVLAAAGTTPMGNFSRAEIQYLQLLVEKLSEEPRFREQLEKFLEEHSIEVVLPKLSGRPKVDFHFIEVGFQWIEDEEERAFLNQIPTTFELPDEEVDKLREAAAKILDRHPDFQELLEALQ